MSPEHRAQGTMQLDGSSQYHTPEMNPSKLQPVLWRETAPDPDWACEKKHNLRPEQSSGCSGGGKRSSKRIKIHPFLNRKELFSNNIT